MSLGTTALAPTVAPGADDGVMEHHRSRSDQRVVLEGAPLEVGQVADHATVADDGGEPGAGVDDRAVLYGGPGSDGDGPVVAPQDRVGPHGRLGADGDVADDHGVGVDVRLGVDGGDEVFESVDGHGPTLWHARIGVGPGRATTPT